MSRVRVRVILAEPDRAYAPGEQVRGRVEVEVDEDCSCKALLASPGWQTFGEANAVEGDRHPVTLASGEWQSGQRLSFPFSLMVPDGPPTYEGSHFSVAWTVRAVASLSMAFDSRGESPLTVLPPPAGAGTLLTKEDSGCAEVGCATVGVAFLVGGGLPILFSRRFPGIGYAIAAAAGGILAAIMIPFALAYRAVGKVSLEAGPSPVARGEEIACRAVLVPRKDFKIRKVVALLKAVESSPKGSGKGKRTLSKDLAEVPVDLTGPATLRKGQSATFAGMLPVPAAAAPSFAAGDHKVVWKLRISVELPVLPNPSWEFEVTVG